MKCFFVFSFILFLFHLFACVGLKKSVIITPWAQHFDFYSRPESLSAASATLANTNMSLCPVSSTLNLTSPEKYYYYPADLYSPIEAEINSAVRCIAQDTSSKIGFNINCHRQTNCTHLCSTTKKYCPVRGHHVLDSMPSGDISLCGLKEKLSSSESVRIFVTGGSVTRGSCTIGCCGSDFCAGDGVYSDRCTWIYYLTEWFKRTFPANISLINLAESGANSQWEADFLGEKLKSKNVDAFTSSDIVLLDHSTNDNALHVVESTIVPGVDALVRGILSRSKPRSMPTIILLDASPKRTDGSKCQYCSSYATVAKHYGIPIWSYRNAVTSSSNADIDNTFYKHFINFIEIRGMHPPWHVHLFMADVYAGVILNSLGLCTQDAVLKRNDWHLKTISDFQPLQTTANVRSCSREVLQLSHETVVKNTSIIGSYHSIPENSWRLHEDVKGRIGGFIRTIRNTTIEPATDIKATLVLRLNISVAELIDKQIDLFFTIYYLRSYENAGVAQVTYCKKKVDSVSPVSEGVLDALWNESFSLPDKWSPPSVVFAHELCKGFAEDSPTIEITHLPLAEREGTQKFKILHVSACF